MNVVIFAKFDVWKGSYFVVYSNGQTGTIFGVFNDSSR